MEFEEIRKVWDTQNVKPLYVMNDTVLHNQVLDKQRRARHITQVSELLLIFVNLGTSIFILGVTLTGSMNMSLIALSIWTGISGAWVLFERVRRTRGNHNFDRSLKGELTYALSIATYQVRLARLGRWNALPTGVLTLLALWESNKAGWVAIAIVLVFIVSYVAAGWETNIYIRRKNDLELLKKKLEAL
jgi:hypothetical protein